MVKSIQYFNEECVPVFERLEDDFLKDPSDIASYITKLTDPFTGCLFLVMRLYASTSTVNPDLNSTVIFLS